MSINSCNVTFSVASVVPPTSTTCSSSTISLHHRLHTHPVRLYSWYQGYIEYIGANALLDFATQDDDGTQGIDPNQLIDTYVAPQKTEPQYIVGQKPGPYVAEHSFNMYARLGARIALLGIDARTEVSH